MGWGDCGKDSRGRPIGYVFEATCDHKGCTKEIHRGLAYVCGRMHGEDEVSCEKYFCDDHKPGCVIWDDDIYMVCGECVDHLKGCRFKENDDGEIIVEL